MDKRKTLGMVTAMGLTAVGLTLSTLAFANHTASTRLKASDFTLTLNSSNGISGSNVTEVRSISTDSGNYQVGFSYQNCSSLNNGHATINAGGKIVNQDHIRSIYSLVANFETSGDLKFRTSYDGATWGGYTSMQSSVEYGLSSNPYYVEFSTDGTHAVNVTSIQFSYSCLENAAALGTTTTTDDTWERVNYESELQSGDEILIAASYSSKWFTLQNSTVSNRDYWLGAESISLNNTKSEAYPTDSNDVWTVTSGSTSGKWRLKNGSNYLKAATSGSYYNIGLTNTYDSTSCDWTLAFSNASVNFTCNGVALGLKQYTQSGNTLYEFAGYQSDTYTKYIYRRVAGTSVTTFDQPVDENGFTAVDSNKDNYTTSSIFDTANGLTVKATFTDGSTQTLSRGSEGYSYNITNSNNEVIDTSKAFGAEGIYTLTINYKKYLPVTILLNVGVYTYLTGITPSMTKTSFTTADVLSTNISTQLTAALTYNVSSLNKTVNYGNFSANNLAVTLIDPNNVDHSLTTAFGTAGTWTLKVYSTTDTSIYGTVQLTVSAIAVTDITISNSALTLHPGESAQLTATVNPTNATNQGIIWTSDDSLTVSVDENGLATAHKVGSAVITATSSDGGHTATCTITVKKQSQTTATITADVRNNTSETDITSSIALADFEVEGITLSSVSASGSIYSIAGNSGIRMGKGKGTGSITFTFTSSKVTGLTLDSECYNNDANVPVKISTSANTSGSTFTINSSDPVDVSSVLSDSEITSITIATTTNSKRINFYGLTLLIGELEPIYPETITLSNASVDIGYTTQLEPVFNPTDTNQTFLYWESSNTNIATVSQDGIVTGIATGNATITATGEKENGDPVSASCTVTVNSVAVTGVTLNKSTLDVSLGATSTLVATVSPANASNKNVTWASSNTSVATVSYGTINALAVGTTTITVKTVDGNKTAQCTVNVVNGPADDYTIMIYMCGADLESDSSQGGYATGDLAEILSVSGKPSGVNIIVETGGAKSWKNYGISNKKLERYHVSDGSLVRDAQLDQASMGLTSTFQSFLEWGINSYPAKKMGVIMWNHGGAMGGCCFDENFDDDSLTNGETYDALEGAFTNTARTTNLDWITYDACLMAVQDVAEYNSHFFNYMLSSQESESGYGYDYDAWLPSLYADVTIDDAELLELIGHTFIVEEEALYSANNWGACDQTQAVYDLTKMASYKSVFEQFASTLNSIIGSDTSKAKKLGQVITNAKEYGCDEYGNSNGFEIFDMENALDKIKANSTFSSVSSQVTSVKNAISQLVVYEEHGDGTIGCGICLYSPCYEGLPYNYAGTDYVSSGFTNWMTVSNKIWPTLYNFDS